MTAVSKLAATAEALAAAIETRRAASGFSTTDFVVTWDFEERRDETVLPEAQTNVRVAVPRAYLSERRISRPYGKAHVAAFDIDVRRRVPMPAVKSATTDRDTIDGLTCLVEELNDFCSEVLDEQRLTITHRGTSYQAQWMDEADGTESKVLVACSTKFLEDQRQFYGVAREVFEITPGT